MMKLTPHEERRVAVRAGCDPRTVRAYVRNLKLPPGDRRQDSTVAARIADALAIEGFTPPPRNAASSLSSTRSAQFSGPPALPAKETNDG